MTMPRLPLDPDAAWRAFEARDRHSDGRFVGAVKTTGIYCKPSCPARRPKRENVEFFVDADAARGAGYRPCLRCKPDEVGRDREAVAKAVRCGGPWQGIVVDKAAEHAAESGG